MTRPLALAALTACTDQPAPLPFSHCVNLHTGEDWHVVALLYLTYPAFLEQKGFNNEGLEPCLHFPPLTFTTKQRPTPT